MELEEQQTNK